ncbi:hypothetical protein [Microcystis aeruginosa]|uniref:hypothetical protein n=1 Tax=Microcystis aeruginosa TaxID=1126 RepID=UPI00031FCD08|nr:hypothetical protein [Microcystis aeruginosa]
MPHLLRFLSHNIHKLLHAYIQLSVISYQLSARKRQESKGKSMVNLSPVSFVRFVTFSLKNVS